MKTSYRYPLTIALAASLGLAACSSSTPGTSSATNTATPNKGGSATIILGVEAVRGLDPAFLFNLTPSGDANRMSAIFDLLLSSDASTGEITPRIAESFASTDGGATWTMKLRSGVKFSDGSAFDAEAVRFNYQRILDPATRSPLAPLLQGASFTVTDPVTLQIKLPQPNLRFNQVVATNLPFIASPTAVRADPAGFAQKPVGGGPFVLSEWVRDDRMVLKANPNYYQQGRPYLDTLTYKVIADPVQRINTVASGQAQAAVPGSELSYRDRAKQANLSVTEAPAGGGPMLMFNTARAPFNDVRARRAVVLTLNLTDFAQIVDPGAKPADGLFKASSPFSSGKPLPQNNPAEAQRLFDELAAAGKPVSFTITETQSGLFKRTAEYIQSRIAEFKNVSSKIDIVDNATLDQRVFRDRNYDLSAQIVPLPDPEPNLYKLLHTGGQTNYMTYSSPAVDAALDAGRSATDDAARAKAYQSVEQLVIDEVPVLPYREQASYTVHSNKLVGLKLQGDGSLLYDSLGLTG